MENHYFLMGKSTISMVGLQHQPVMIFPYLSWSFQVFCLNSTVSTQKNLTFFSHHFSALLSVAGSSAPRQRGMADPNQDGWVRFFWVENRRGWDELGWFNPRYMIHIWSISGQYMINIWWFWSLAALIFGWVQSQWRSDLFRKTPVTCSSANGAHVLQREIRQRYPLVNIQKTMENHHFLQGKSTISMGYFL